MAQMVVDCLPEIEIRYIMSGWLKGIAGCITWKVIPGWFQKVSLKPRLWQWDFARSTPSSSTARVTGPARRTAAAMHLVVLQKDAPGDEATKAAVKKVTTFCKEYYLKKDPSAAVWQLVSAWFSEMCVTIARNLAPQYFSKMGLSENGECIPSFHSPVDRLFPIKMLNCNWGK